MMVRSTWCHWWYGFIADGTIKTQGVIITWSCNLCAMVMSSIMRLDRDQRRCVGNTIHIFYGPCHGCCDLHVMNGIVGGDMGDAIHMHDYYWINMIVRSMYHNDTICMNDAIHASRLPSYDGAIDGLSMMQSASVHINVRSQYDLHTHHEWCDPWC